MNDSTDLRAGRASRLLQHYQRMRTGFDPIEDPRLLLTELIEDLLHWGKRDGVSFHSASADAASSFSQEKDNEEAGQR